MSDEVDALITFACYYGGKFDTIGGNLIYVGGGHRYVEARPSSLFVELVNHLPVSLYGQRVWYKVPFDGVEDRRLLINGSENFKKMCRSAFWCKTIEIFVEPDETERVETVRDVNSSQTNRDGNERRETGIDDNERERHMFPEEARVERNVENFVDEDIDEQATPVCSDDDEDERLSYLTYKKGSGELKLGQAFPSLEAFRKAMIEYVLKQGWNVKNSRWDKGLAELQCASVAEEGQEKCLWRIYCSYEAPLQKWMVKTYIKNHTCVKTGHSKLITQEVIAKLFVDDIRDNPAVRPKDILAEIQKRWELTVTIDQCRNAKDRALEIIQEENDLQFSKLRNYRLELLESNVGSTVEVETYEGDDGRDIFDKFYICFGALKKIWSSHCRPIFGLDGCFLKCTIKGQLLAAVGRDANNQMFPIAWVVVDVENEPNWTWFIEKLQKDLNLQDGDGFTVISDRQKGLVNAVTAILPKVEHRMCARHIYANLKKKHPNRADMKALFWKVAKSYNTPQYMKNLDAVKAYDMDVYDSMMLKNPKNCSLAYFKPTSTCDDVSNNISEAFNHAIDLARSMPLVEMLETIRRKAMLRIEARRVKSMKHRGKFSIKAMAKVEEEQKKVRNSSIYPYGHDCFEVKEMKSSYKVKMLERTCTCRKWQMSELPCRHALKVISVKKRKPEDYMADCYLTSRWRNQYQTPIEGVRGENFWEENDEGGIVPPATKSKEPRERKKIQKRIKGRNESPSKKKPKARQESPTKISKAKRIIHCGNCGEVGHNTRRCQNVVLAMHRPPKKKKVSKETQQVGETSSQQMQSQILD